MGFYDAMGQARQLLLHAERPCQDRGAAAMINRYPGKCGSCGGRVSAQAGTLRRAGRVWTVYHLSCAQGGYVNTIAIPDGYGGYNHYTRNARGRCEDAPCCGCCTI